MDAIVRNVSDLTPDERHVYENVLGQPLRDNQRVLVQLVEDASRSDASQPSVLINGADDLPEWCTIWADLDDNEIAELESAILQRSDSRPT